MTQQTTGSGDSRPGCRRFAGRARTINVPTASGYKETPLAHHLFDVRESATHELVAKQLRDLADQFAAGSVDLAYEEWQGAIEVIDPVDVVVDLKRAGHHMDLVIHLTWATADSAN